MAKIGDTVRFLNSTGGGKITRIQDKVAYVEDEDGFETPILLKEVVVVMPAGLDKPASGFKKMFDQEAFDEGRREEPRQAAREMKPEPAPEPELPLRRPPTATR